MLLDHFQPPLSVRRHWHAFHNAWATYIAAALNVHLPDGYFAEPNVQFGIEIDVAAFEELDTDLPPTSPSTGVGLTTWTPTSPTQTIPFQLLTDLVEVAVFGQEGGPRLVGAIELISPANKDRLSQRNAFVSKCESYLRQGIGVVVVDIVTSRKANLHESLIKRLGGVGTPPDDVPLLYTAAYRPQNDNGATTLAVWLEPLSIGEGLPTMPLWIGGSTCLPLALSETYSRTCREQRIGR